ncbi:MAG: lytic transglycosylase domain-containing protein [Patescibacteria group bacterium]
MEKPGSRASETPELSPEARLQLERQAALDKSRAKRGDLSKDIWSQLGEMGKQLQEVFTKLSDEVKGFLEKSFGLKFDKSAPAGESEKPVNLPRNLVGDLQKVLTENPQWLVYAKEASEQYGVPLAGLFAIIKNESNFDPEASSSVAGGLGQFVNRTWLEFQGENQGFQGLTQRDPRAAIFATAWYCRKLAIDCRIDLKASDAFAKIWQAYHEGPEGYKRLQAYLKGEGELSIPATSEYQKYKTPAAYAVFLKEYGQKVQATFVEYSGILA